MRTEFGSVDRVMLHMHVIRMTKIGNTNKKKIPFMPILMDQWYLHPIVASLLSVKNLKFLKPTDGPRMIHVFRINKLDRPFEETLTSLTLSLITIMIF